MMSVADAFNKALAFVSDSSPIGKRAWNVVLAAVRTGNLAVNTPHNEHGRTLLHCAAHVTVTQLLALGASPAQPDAYGFLPLHFAMRSLQKFRMLSAGGFLAHDTTGFTPLHLLAQEIMVASPDADLMNVLQWMVEQPECAVNAENRIGFTALDILGDMAETADAREVVRTAMEQRTRWSSLRAAWIATVAVAVSG
jgi:hypothetical protein